MSRTNLFRFAIGLAAVLTLSLLPALTLRAQEGTNWGFEDGTIDGWFVVPDSGPAFANQPTYGPNTTARRPDQPPNQEGDYWIGTYEDRSSPDEKFGGIQGDGPTGQLATDSFTVDEPYLSFLIGGGDDIDQVYVALLVDNVEVLRSTGARSESMLREVWDVSEFIGLQAQILIADDSSGSWGHINADDFRLDKEPPPDEVPDDQKTEDGPKDGGEGQPGDDGDEDEFIPPDEVIPPDLEREIPVGVACPGGNWGFEQGLTCWVPDGNAFVVPTAEGTCPMQPVLGDVVNAERIHIAGRRPGNVGGDYWKTVYPIGHRGDLWIGTFDTGADPCAQRQPSDAYTGTLTRDFPITQRYIDFLIGGGNDVNRTKVELYVPDASGAFTPVNLATGRRNEVMRREIWDVGQHVGKTGRIVITDSSNTSWGHINVDDFRFSNQDPRPDLIRVTSGGFTDFRDPDAPVWGFADTHAHPMANRGFGGVFIYGDVVGPPDRALSTFGDVVAHGPLGTGGGLSLNPLLQFVEGTGHLNGGYPTFDGWPKYNSIIHQQMYIDWIRRAWEGGLRLMVADSVHNPFLAEQFGDRHPFDDISTYNREVEGMIEVARQNSSWMEIALTPRDARRIILEGKLAVVLGIETPAFANCQISDIRPVTYDPGELISVFDRSDLCTPEQVTRELERVHRMGVRTLYPIHISNNAFGGSAIYNDSFSVANRWQTGRYFEVEDGSSVGVEFRLSEREPAQVSFFRSPIRWHHTHAPWVLAGVTLGAFYSPPDYAGMLRRTPVNRHDSGHVVDCNQLHRPSGASDQGCRGMINAQGLTDLGRHLLREMKRLKMIVDVDHMSEKTTDDVLTMFAGNYPVVSGHTGFREIALRRGTTNNVANLAHESAKSRRTMRRIVEGGGMISVISHVGDTAGLRVRNMCANSSASWAGAYRYAVSVVGTDGISIGSEGNGLNGLPGPRFGPGACDGFHGDGPRERMFRADQVRAQRNGVRYDTPIRDYRVHRFEGGCGPCYTGEQRDIWEAIAIFKSNTEPDRAEGPGGATGWITRTWVTQTKIVNLAKGFYCRDQDRPFISIAETSWDERKAACLVARGQSPRDASGRHLYSEEVSRLHAQILPVWSQWNEMQSGTNTPMQRYVMGRRDFDVNLDGVSHYGIFPDFLQDVVNVGLSVPEMTPLFRSAEQYIRVWERAEGTRPLNG